MHIMPGHKLGARWTWRPAWTSCFSRSNSCLMFQGLTTNFSRSNSCLMFQGLIFSRSNSTRLSPALAVPGHPAGRPHQHWSHLLDGQGHGVQAHWAGGGEVTKIYFVCVFWNQCNSQTSLFVFDDKNKIEAKYASNVAFSRVDDWMPWRKIQFPQNSSHESWLNPLNLWFW